MEWRSIDLSSKLSLTCGGNAKCSHPIPDLPVGIGNTLLAVFKTNWSALLSVESPGIFSSWLNKGERETFFGGYKKGELHCEINSKSTWFS